MPRNARARFRCGSAALLWGVVWFLAGQTALAVTLERWWLEARDPEAAYRAARLRDWQKRDPHRPCVVVIGSSRAAMGLRPDVLRTVLGDEAPDLYNFAHTGAGPATELVLLHRLLRAGLRPDALIVEVHPALLHQPAGAGETTWQLPQRMSLGDVRVLYRFADRPAAYLAAWLHARLVPAYDHRVHLKNRLAPSWLSWGERLETGWLEPDQLGWLPYSKERVTAREYQEGIAIAWQQYGACFPDFHVTPEARRAVGNLLAVCRTQGIRVVLLTLPEGSVFQSWYSSAALAEIDAYLTELCREHGVCWVDARSWSPDEDFCDNHHLLRSGAAHFSERFGREVLRPLVRRGYRLPPGRWPPPTQTAAR